MKSKSIPISLSVVVSVAVVSTIALSPPQDKYTVQVPGGLAFSEFKGYESWR